MSTAVFLYAWVCIIAAFVTGAQFGSGRGRARERRRCLGLAAQSWQSKGARLSPTARRIYHSIESGHERLITEDDFFGERTK